MNPILHDTATVALFPFLGNAKLCQSRLLLWCWRVVWFCCVLMVYYHRHDQLAVGFLTLQGLFSIIGFTTLRWPNARYPTTVPKLIVAHLVALYGSLFLLQAASTFVLLKVLTALWMGAHFESEDHLLPLLTAIPSVLVYVLWAKSTQMFRKGAVGIVTQRSRLNPTSS